MIAPARSPEPRARPRRLLRAAAWVVAVSAGALLGLSLYVQSPGFRARLLAALNRELEGQLRGRATLTDLSHLGLTGARLERAELLDERGVPVLTLDGVRVGYDPWLLLAPFLPGSSSGLEIEHARVERARVRLLTDPDSGQLSLLRALGKEQAPEPHEAERPGLSIELSRIELGEVLVDLEQPELGQLHARLDHVRGSARVAGEDSELNVERFGLQLVWNEQRWLEGTASFRLAPGGALGSTFHGFLRGTEVDAAAQLDARVLDARLDVPHALPEQLRELWAGWPLAAPLSAQLRAQGPLAALQLSGNAQSDAGRLELRGDAALEGAPRARLDVDVHALNARAFAPEAPRSALEAHAELTLSPGERGPKLAGQLTTQPAAIGSVALPAATLTLQGEAGQASAHFRLGDARGDLEGELRVADGALELEAQLRNLSLAAIPELGGRVRGGGELSARARFADGRVRGSLDGQLRGIDADTGGFGSGRLDGRFDAPLATPEQATLDLTLDASSVRLGPLQLERAVVHGSGPWQDSRIEAELSGRDGGRGTLAARLGLQDEARASGLALSWSQRGVLLEARASEYRPERGLLRVESVQLTGAAGTLTGSARLEPGRYEVTARAQALDTDQLARALGVSSSVARGVLTGSVELRSSPSEETGALQLSADKLVVQNLAWRHLDVSARLDAGQLALDASATDPSLGQLALKGSAALAGPVREPSSWQRATGSGSLTLERLPLWPLGLVLARQGRVTDLDGRLSVSLAVERGAADVLPNLFLQAHTEELALGLAPEQPEAEGLHLTGYAVHGSGSIDGRSGHGAATVLITDEHGALVTSSGSLEVDLPLLLRDPASIASRLLQTPLDALLRLHPRPVSLLPPPFGVRDLGGSVEATLQLRGSLAEPTLSLAARGYQLVGGAGDAERAVDVTSVLEYSPNSGRLRGIADVVQAGRSLVAARVEGRVPNPLGPEPSLAQAELRAAAMLNGVPLELWPVAARERMEARLYGSIDVEAERGQLTRERAHLEIANLTARGHAFGNGRLTFDNGPGGLRADLRVGAGERYLRATLRGAEGGTSDAGDGALTGSVTARDFDASSLSPLTHGLLSRLAGDMNADLKFVVRPLPADDFYLGIDGKAKLSGGSAHIEELGLEVREIAADIIARSTPEYTVLQIDPLSAKARSRNPNLKGDAELWLRGRRVVNGEANLTLEDVPLSLKGVSRGIARGHTRARLERMPDYLQLEVKIPDLRVRLPPSSTRTLIALDQNPDLHVLQSAEAPEERPSDALLWKIAFDLGNRVRIERGDLDVPLTGQPTLEYRYELRPSGSIQALPGGRIMLFDQSFSVDRGLLTFVPDEPDNPRVDLTASWRAPDGTTVYVDVTGRAKDASVLTRDDRGLQDVERFYLITGGAVPEGREFAANANGDPGALGQTFSLGINELLRDSLGNVAVSVGTTADNRASYSASVRLTDKLTFQGSFQPGSESNLEESTNDLTGTLDYRFSRRWSLRTEGLGTSGGAFDLLWSHRY